MLWNWNTESAAASAADWKAVASMVIFEFFESGES